MKKQLNKLRRFFARTGGKKLNAATARDAASRELRVYVVNDASATFDLTGPDGKLHRAERVHSLVMASLHTFFATVTDTAAVLKQR